MSSENWFGNAWVLVSKPEGLSIRVSGSFRVIRTSVSRCAIYLDAKKKALFQAPFGFGYEQVICIASRTGHLVALESLDRFPNSAASEVH